jgi:hypothetical protein
MVTEYLGFLDRISAVVSPDTPALQTHQKQYDSLDQVAARGSANPTTTTLAMMMSNARVARLGEYN